MLDNKLNQIYEVVTENEKYKNLYLTDVGFHAAIQTLMNNDYTFEIVIDIIGCFCEENNKLKQELVELYKNRNYTILIEKDK